MKSVNAFGRKMAAWLDSEDPERKSENIISG